MDSVISSEPTAVSIFGLGYVGCVAAACLAHRRCQVIGVEPMQQKVDIINEGRAPFHEPGLDDLMLTGRESGRIRATSDVAIAVAETDISIICVGTPPDDDGALDLRYVESVTQQIRDEVERQCKPLHRFVYRSTMLPGSTRRIAEQELQSLIADGRAEVYFYPEFLRQGSAVKDYEEPSLSVLGALNPQPTICPSMGILFEEATEVVDLETAELLKYACNAFHAVKVAFANEIGRIGKGFDLDSRKVMELLVKDTRLNISKSYLRPGNPFGGSCLPKDVSALTIMARKLGVSVPTLDSLMPSNELHREHLRELALAGDGKAVVFVGFAFKDRTDDLRGSALLKLASDLIADGIEVRIFDPLLDPAQMVGSSRAAMEAVLPSLPDRLSASLEEALGYEGVVLASNRCVGTDALLDALGEGHHVIDVTGWSELATGSHEYEGICW